VIELNRTGERMNIRTMIRPLAFAAAACLANAATAKNFSDTEFDLANYTISTFQTGGAVIDIAQNALAGNPGATLIVATATPATGGTTFYSREYFLGRSFTYDPASEGAIGSVSWSLDVSFQALSAGFNLVSLGAGIVVSQAGNLYVSGAALPLRQGVFQTAQAGGLAASAFDLVTNLTTGATNAALHPNFAAGAMQFGTLAGLYISPGSPAHRALVKADNLSISISPVPEPSQYAMFAIGVALLLNIKRRAANGQLAVNDVGG
jgi:hypothetical protein